MAVTSVIWPSRSAAPRSRRFAKAPARCWPQRTTATLPEATLQIIASRYYELLGEFSVASLKQKLGEDPLKYTRFLNVFARLTREILNLKKYREACAQAAAAELKRLDPNREFSEREDEILTDRMDDFFKKPRRHRSQPESPTSTQRPEPQPGSPAPEP